MRRSLIVATIAALLMVVSLAPAGATPPSEVNFEVESSLLGDPGPFVASGPAVDGGLICAAGTVVDESSKATGLSPTGFNFQGIKHFICDDGSGEFFVNLQARIDFRRGTTFHWSVLGGTGDYEVLHGAGSGVGLDLCGPDCVFDVYDGGLHHD